MHLRIIVDPSFRFLARSYDSRDNFTHLFLNLISKLPLNIANNCNLLPCMDTVTTNVNLVDMVLAIFTVAVFCPFEELCLSMCNLYTHWEHVHDFVIIRFFTVGIAVPVIRLTRIRVNIDRFQHSRKLRSH